MAMIDIQGRASGARRTLGTRGTRATLGACGTLRRLGIGCAALLLAACSAGGSAPPPRVVKVALTVAPGTIALGAQRATADLINGSFMPPLLRVQPGDELDITLRNSGSEPTNLHLHGLTVSPLGTSDNVFLTVGPGQTQDYRFRIPASHRPGLFWYHVHQHGLAEAQVLRGMAGGLIVEGLERSVPELQGLTERVVLLKDTKIANGQVTEDDAVPYLRTVNGALDPTFSAAPGEVQLWRIAAMSANSYYTLELAGHSFWVVARDGNRVATLREQSRLTLGPGQRVEALVRTGPAGSYRLRTLTYNTGPGGDTYPAADLATLRVEGAAAARAPTLPFALPPLNDLRAGPIDAEREIVFDSVTTNGNEVFRVNGRPFDMQRVDLRVPLGRVERWTLRNPTDEEHIFHIHQVPFQVVEVNGQAVAFDGYRDLVNIPVGGQVKVIIPFTDPVIVGKFVFHCHILEHEDGGMMAVIEVFDPDAQRVAARFRDDPPNEPMCRGSALAPLAQAPAARG